MSYQCPKCGEKFDVTPFALMNGMMSVEQIICRCKKCHYDFSEHPLSHYKTKKSSFSFKGSRPINFG